MNTTMQEKTNEIIHGVIWKQLLFFFFPILLGSLFQQLYNTADAVIVGRFLGKEALAAVGGSAGMIIALIVGFFVGLTSGASVIVSQFFGCGDKKGVNHSIHTLYAFSIVGSIFIMIFGIITAGPVLSAMNTPEELMADSILYLQYILEVSSLPLFITRALHCCGRSEIPDVRSMPSLSAVSSILFLMCFLFAFSIWESQEPRLLQ